MNVLGTILAIVIVAVLSIVLAPVGGIVLLAATLVMALKIYQQNRQIGTKIRMSRGGCYVQICDVWSIQRYLCLLYMPKGI